MLFLLTGASGAGKSSARRAVKIDLAPAVECVELKDLGPVPAVPDVAWRQRMAECAVARAGRLDADGRDLLLAGDPVAPGEVLAAPSAAGVDIAVCLLDVDEATQKRNGCGAAVIPRICWGAMSRSRSGCAGTPRIPVTCRRF